MAGTTLGDLAKKLVAMEPGTFASTYPSAALVLLLSAMSGVDSELSGDLPEDGLMFTDILLPEGARPRRDVRRRPLAHGRLLGAAGVARDLPRTSGANAPEIRIGRGESCEICLPYATVSEAHGSFVRRGESWAIVPDDTTNGTFLNENRLEPGSTTLLADGGVVAFGPEVRAQFFSPAGLRNLLASCVPVKDQRR